jgi:hypothetical protein
MLHSSDNGEALEVVLPVRSPCTRVNGRRPFFSAVAEARWVSTFYFKDGEEALRFGVTWRTDRVRFSRGGGHHRRQALI